MSDSTDVDVIVIGGGISGLAFAWKAVAAGRRTQWRAGHFRGGRPHIRRRAADMALELLLSFISEAG